MPARISMLHEADTYKRDCMSSCREIAANRITEIPPGAFETLSSLKELDLRGNSLTNASIASGAFQGLHSLHVLYVPVHTGARSISKDTLCFCAGSSIIMR
eukprot:gb/GECG01009153.1/.p1 GENE.gb/GECG01009153.1/~~gb/GECG01009153.1/.p1  ORF type:complete len:101 (+),score=5.27 gb/GECG01009153.1/:1-303(+)